MISYFSFYHSSLFVLGSVLSWAVIARSLTCGPVIKTIISLGKANSNSVNIKMFLGDYNDDTCLQRPSISTQKSSSSLKCILLGLSSSMLKVSLNTLDHIDTRLGNVLGKIWKDSLKEIRRAMHQWKVLCKL